LRGAESFAIGSTTLIQIKVTPKASRHQIVGWENEVLKIRLHAIPDKGKANDALIAFLAEELHIAKSSISLISGQTSRLKRVKIEGMTLEEFQRCLRERWCPKVTIKVRNQVRPLA
jgi:hypothetical protein